MKRTIDSAFSEVDSQDNAETLEPPEELLIALGKNALSTLNRIPLFSRNWIPMLNLLANGISFSDLSQYVEHGSDSALMKALHKSSKLESNPLIEDVEKTEHVVKAAAKKKAKHYLVTHTRLHDERLITKESLPKLYAEYIGSVEDHLCRDTFVDVYHNLRILKDKHCNYTIYSCPKCDDELPQVRALLNKLRDDPNSEDYKTAMAILAKLEEHHDQARVQTRCFELIWNEPPPFALVVAEDAGKRFVLGGKGCAHVMMLRWKLDNGMFLYFFCTYLFPLSRTP
jgi:hypothetical protein